MPGKQDDATVPRKQDFNASRAHDTQVSWFGSARSTDRTQGCSTVTAMPTTVSTPTVHGPAAPKRGWYPDQRKTIYLCAVVLGLGAFFMVTYARIIWGVYKAQPPEQLPIYGDFFALWSYAKIIAAHPVAELYNSSLLHARQVDLGMDPTYTYPFPYPPTFVFVVWPLDLLQYEANYLLAMFVTLAVFVWAIWKTCSRRWFCLLGVIVAPATTATIFAGQIEFLAAALLTAGIQLAKSRPILAGVLIGLVSYKPQLGFLVPIALVAAGLWTTVWAASATVVAMAGAATLAFGWHIWGDWVSMLPAYADWFDGVTESLKSRPTVQANLQLLGVTLPWARAVQMLVGACVAVFIWRCFRRNPGRLASAALLVGTLAATPHAFFYNLPMATAAMVLFIEDRLEAHAPFNGVEVATLVLATMLPVFMLLKTVVLPFTAVPLLLLFAVVVRAARSR
jgi:hypothetical protein